MADGRPTSGSSGPRGDAGPPVSGERPPAAGPGGRGSPPPAPSSPAVRRARRVAVAGLVLGLVPCCPPSGFAGSMLGLLVLFRDPGRTLPPKVRRIAIAAVLVGALGSMLNAFLLQRAAERVAEEQSARIRARVETAFDAAAADWPASGLEAFAAGADRPSADELESFVRGVEERFGPYRDLRFVSRGTGGSSVRPTVEAAVRLRFEREEVLGSLVLVGTPALPLPDLFLRSITIEPPGATPIRLGPAADRGEASAGGGAAADEDDADAGGEGDGGGTPAAGGG